MENYNNLKFKTFRINEKLLNIPMEDIRQEYDDSRKFAKSPYLFKIVYIAKYLKKTNEFICYLAPNEMSKLPIVKATIPLELIRTTKLIPSYNEGDMLEDNERFIINERKFRLIDKLNEASFNNRLYSGYYVLCYGYLINEYKDDNAMTKIPEGIQQFKIFTRCNKTFRDKNYITSCYVTNKLSKIFEVSKIPRRKEFMEFKPLPKNFFVDRK